MPLMRWSWEQPHWCTKLENCAVTVVQLPKVDPENFISDKFRGGVTTPVTPPPLHTGLVYIAESMTERKGQFAIVSLHFTFLGVDTA